MIFNVTDATGAISGMPMVRVYDSTGKLKGFVGPGGGTVTSVGLSMPSGFTVTNSPVTGSGVLTVTGNGTTLDYIDGTGAIQTFPTINTYTVDNGLTESPVNNFQLGGTLQDTIITGANFNFTYTGLKRFLVDVGDFVNIVATDGTDTCTIDVSTGSATPYIELNVKNSTINHLIAVDDTQILIRTPGVDTASVSNGDVLTLIDATSGEVEFQTPTGATYTVDNGLTESPANNFQLGGTLIQDTNIDGAGNTWQLNFTDLYSSTNTARYSYSFATSHAANNTLLSLDSNSNVSRFSHEDAGSGDISAIELIGTELRVQTPAYATATIGDVLTLLDNTTGEAEWQTIPGTALGFQDVLINDSTLTQNNTVLGANFNFTWSGFNRFRVLTDEFTEINSTAGSNIAAATVNSLGAAPYIDLNVKNGTDIVGIYLDTNEIDLYTPAIDNATASVGDVFTLVNAASGEGEWQTPTGGGGLLHGTASGTDTYTSTITGATAYADGDAYIIKFTNGNTTTSTLNINSLGAVPLYRNNDGELIGGDIWNDAEMLCIYDATTTPVPVFRCIGTSPNSLFSYVTNDDTVTITKGQPVYASGGVGDRLKVKLAYNTSDATSAQTIGLVYSDSIASGQKGIIIMQGLLSNLSILPTSTWSDGSPVYLGTTAGAITPTKQYAPNHLVYLGFVTTASNGNAGRLYVRPQNGYELDELHNVQAQSPADKDTLWFDNSVTPKQWKTGSVPSLSGTFTIGTTIDGSGGTITVGLKGFVKIPYACTITGWTVMASTATAGQVITIDVWKSSSGIPTVSDTIINTGAGGVKPFLSSGQQLRNSASVANWTTAVAANDYIGFYVDAATTVSWVILQIFVTKT